MAIVPIVDPVVKIDPQLFTYQTGLEYKVFVRSPPSSSEETLFYKGQSWPGRVHFLDFTHRNMTKWLFECLKKYKEIVDFDGLWLDMNEPANFDSGSVNAPTRRGYYNTNYPQYDINNGAKKLPLFHQTLPMDSPLDNGSLMISEHNIYGLSEAQVVRKVLDRLMPGSRTFLLTRSAFPGAGQFTASWLGDNHSSFSQLKESIWGVLKYQLFGGIAMTGPDLCGFNGDSDEELCSRWMAVGAFFPFSRNHNSIGSRINQEPYQWKSTISVTKKYYGIKYSLLPVWITLLYYNHILGSPVIRPFDMFRSTQFFVGADILVCPVTKRGALSVDCLLPFGIWYDMEGWSKNKVKTENKLVTFASPIDHIPVFVRSGTVLFKKQPMKTVRDTLATDYSIEILLNAKFEASGVLYIDDNSAVDPKNNYNKLRLFAYKDKSVFRISSNGYYGLKGSGNMNISSIKIRTATPLGVKSVLQPVNAEIVREGLQGFELLTPGLMINKPFDVDLLVNQ